MGFLLVLAGVVLAAGHDGFGWVALFLILAGLCAPGDPAKPA